MEFRKMVMITRYERQQKRHRCIEQSVGLCGRGWGWDGLGEWLWNIYYHTWNGSPVQVWCMIQGAWGWCTGMTQRDGMGQEVGGGFRMGNTCTPVADSCQCMAKPIQYCKVISLQNKRKILNNDAVKMLHSICQHIWKTPQWSQDWKMLFFIPIPKNVQTLIPSHTFHMPSKVMLKILQAGPQQ